MCKVMGSKQKPLWLVCENADLYGPAIPLMYKRGDGEKTYRARIPLVSYSFCGFKQVTSDLNQENGTKLQSTAFAKQFCNQCRP